MGMPLAFGEGDTKGRIKNLARWKKPKIWITITAGIVCTVVILVCICNPKEDHSNSTEASESLLSSEEPYILETFEKTVSLEELERKFALEQEWVHTTYYKMSDGTWKTDEYVYQYCLEVSGRLNNAAKDTTYIILSNEKGITFEQAWKASGFSSNMNDYFNPEDAMIVATILHETSASLETAAQRYNLGDLDGNGMEEYMMVSEEGRLADHDGYLSFYFNGEKIYEYDAILVTTPGNAEYIDLDMDGEKEVFFSLYPRVNSMPLMEYAVLKKVGNEWKILEMIHGETMLDNAFPISVQYGEEKNTIVITCEGTQEQIVYNFTAHYEGLIKEYNDIGLHANVYENILKGADYTVGDSFGGVASWGIWTIESAHYAGTNCLIATHGIQGPEGKNDILGELDIYFNYNSEGLVNILNMEFRENSAAN